MPINGGGLHRRFRGTLRNEGNDTDRKKRCRSQWTSLGKKVTLSPTDNGGPAMKQTSSRTDSSA